MREKYTENKIYIVVQSCRNLMLGSKGGNKRGEPVQPVPKYSEAHIYPTRRTPLGGATKGSRQQKVIYSNAIHYPDVPNSG